MSSLADILRRALGRVVVLTLTLAAAASGQEVPVIVTSGIGEVRVPPERAIVQIGVESQDSSAARAAAATAAKVRAVVDTLVSLGFARDSLPTVDYRIGRNYDMYRMGGTANETKAYSAESAIELVVNDLNRIGEVIDAALAAGANDIPYIRFDADESGAARREALAQAFSQAKDDAEALANSAGGVLGDLVEVSTETVGFPGIELAGYVELATPVTPQGIVRKVRVVAKWQLQER